MNICIYGAASPELAQIYYDKTEELGRQMAKRGHGLVFGGGETGLMGAAARGVDAEGGYLLGIAPLFFDIIKCLIATIIKPQGEIFCFIGFDH